jgi:hypothetical protein
VNRNQSVRDEYRSAAFEAVVPAYWRGIVGTACREALQHDQRAREWVQRVLGIADAMNAIIIPFLLLLLILFVILILLAGLGGGD